MNRHLHLNTDQQGIAWLHVDHADSGVNILSQDLLEELAGVLDELESTRPQGLVILSDKRNGFIAGADVSSFKQGMHRHEAEAHIRQVHGLFDRIAALPLPTLALIHGYCLGGGLELALSCDYRVARDDEGTRLAFPEVRLGIFPGYGGTLRSIQRIGALPAMKLMLSGRSLSGRQARKMGLVDRAVPERQLRDNALDMLQRQPTPQQAPWLQRLLNSLPARYLMAPLLSRETAKHAQPAHYPAPFALIDHWKTHGGDAKAMLKSEAVEVSRLLTGETAQNLIRVFFLQERMKSLGGSDFKPQHVHVVGGGIMGGDIAAWCALKGLQVTLQDREPRYLTQAVARAHQLFKRKLRSPRLVMAAMDRLTPDPRGYGVRQADVAIEAIFEDLEAKQQLFRELETQLKPDAILATNTSSIPLEDIAQGLDSPQRLIGLHFFNPVAKMQLVEVVHGEQTDPALIERGAAFVRRIERLPLPVRSSPGFLVNRILMPYLLEAMSLLDEGVPAPAIDRAAVDFGMPMGPIELADAVGLDICLAVAKKLAPLFDLTIPKELERRVEQKKHLGKKTGRGFYRYDKGRLQREKIPGDYRAPADLADRMIFRLLNESVACLREGVVEDADLLDAGVIFGTGYAPFRGGPMHTIYSGGLEQQRSRLEALEKRHGGKFHPDSGWTHLGEV